MFLDFSRTFFIKKNSIGDVDIADDAHHEKCAMVSPDTTSRAYCRQADTSSGSSSGWSAWTSVADIPADTKSSTASTGHRMCRTPGLPWQMSLCEQDQADVVFKGGNAGRDPLLFSRFPRR